MFENYITSSKEQKRQFYYVSFKRNLLVTKLNQITVIKLNRFKIGLPETQILLKFKPNNLDPKSK